MKVALWAEIRRLAEIERLSHRAISRRLRCSRRTVVKALGLDMPPTQVASKPRGCILEPFYAKIDALVKQYPDLSAVRVHEEISRGPKGFQGEVTLVRRYLRRSRPGPRGRVYQEVHYEPGEALQVDWGSCGSIRIGDARRKVSVFVAMLCYSRMLFIEFALSEKKEEFYTSIQNALRFFGGSTRKIIVDNLKAAVLNGSGRHACFHPEFLALCGHFCMEAVACERRDPESKGGVEDGVRYVKHNALAGRQLETLEDYAQLAVYWRDEVANKRVHARTRERPIKRYERERATLRPFPAVPLDTDVVVSTVVTPHVCVRFDTNRYSVPPELRSKPVIVRADRASVRVLFEGTEVAHHQRCYDRNQSIQLDAHRAAALRLRHRAGRTLLEADFDAMGPEAVSFHLKLRERPLRTTVHLRKLLQLAAIYGRTAVLAAIAKALDLETFDACYVENLLLQDRRRQQLPSPIQLRPRRAELLETTLDPPDPGVYDRLFGVDAESTI